MVSEAANADICLYFAPNNAFNYFFEGKPVWQIAKARLIIALCTRASTPRKSGGKRPCFCSRQLGRPLPPEQRESGRKCCAFSFLTRCFGPSQPSDWRTLERLGWVSPSGGECGGGACPCPLLLPPPGGAQPEGAPPPTTASQPGKACSGWDAVFFKYYLSIAVYIPHCFLFVLNVQRAQNSKSRESVRPVWAHYAPCLGLSPAVGVGPHGPGL